MCKHISGLKESECAECNGQAYEIRKQIADNKYIRRKTNKLRAEYFKAYRNGDLDMIGISYTASEIDSILSTEYTISNVYELALELGRTIKAIKMIYHFAYGKNIDARNDSWYKLIQTRKIALNQQGSFLHCFNHLKYIQIKGSSLNER